MNRSVFNKGVTFNVLLQKHNNNILSNYVNKFF